MIVNFQQEVMRFTVIIT